MVNEAFITEIQSGNREHLEELWDSVRPFVERQARRRVRACQNGGAYCGTEVEDLIHVPGRRANDVPWLAGFALEKRL